MAVAAKVASVTLKINLLRSAIQSGAAVELRKQELLARNVELKAQVAAAVKELTALEVAHGKVQVQLPVKSVKEAPKAAPKAASAPKVETAKAVESKPKPDLDPEQIAKQKAKKAAKDAKKAAKPKAAAVENDSEKPVDLCRVKMMVGLITEVALHPDADGLYLEKMECKG